MKNIDSKLKIRSKGELDIAVAKELQNSKKEKSIAELIDEQSKDKCREDNKDNTDA